MLCPDCGNEMPDTAKSCSYCGRSLRKVKRSGGEAMAVKILLVILAIALIGGAVFAMASQFKRETVTGPEYDPSAKWVAMDFSDYGIKMEVPGTGWSLYYDAQSQVVFKDGVRGALDISFLGAMSLNPDAHRVDNKPQVFTVISQDSVFLEGFGEAMYTVVSCKEDGVLVNKHQLYFKRTFKMANKQTQTFTYVITMTCSSGLDSQYAPLFRHMLESIELYE
ncbi:MAG: zinc ribbon domain-containing protein [Eubacteriales bacterium]|nr:zinc ribbon domain-containing protein [Eubacteriales bacterium]